MIVTIALFAAHNSTSHQAASMVCQQFPDNSATSPFFHE